MPKTKISNLQFIATLLHLQTVQPHQQKGDGTYEIWLNGRASNFSYTEIVSSLQTWRGIPTYKVNWEGKTKRNHWGSQYLSYAPFRGGQYKNVLWDTVPRYDYSSRKPNKNGLAQFKKLRSSYRLLPRAKKYIVKGATSVQDLMDNYMHKSES